MGGGGGGSGGRLGVNFLQAFNVSNQQNQSLSWSGSLDLTGGKSGPLFVNTTIADSNTSNQILASANQTKLN